MRQRNTVIVGTLLAVLQLGTLRVLADTSRPSAALESGILMARLVELADKPDQISTHPNQELVDRSFANFEDTASSTDLRSAFAALRPRFARIASADERAEDLKRLSVLRQVYLAGLPAQARAANVIGSAIQQIYYNASVLKDADADAKMRAQVASANVADEVSPDFQQTRRELGTIRNGDLGRVAVVSKKLIDEIES